MSQPDFYEIFGLSPSASQEEIRAAHRELVKRYHPDIYSTSGDKARATEKLQAINQAYAVLGSPERRREYDAGRIASLRRAATAPRRSPAAVRRGPSMARSKAPPKSAQIRRKLQWTKKFFTFRWMAGAVALVALFVAAAYFLTREPPVIPIWVLLQKTELETAAGGLAAGASGWEQLGRFAIRSQCAADLKARVNQERAQGSRVVFDETRGMVAITVLLIDRDSELQRKELVAGQNGIAKRVRHYECRAIPVRQPESWMRRKLRLSGLVR